MKTVTLISKDDCSLCDKAYDTLVSIQKEKPFHLRVRKIEPGTDDYEKYKEKIPVVLVEDSEVFYYRVKEDALKELL